MRLDAVWIKDLHDPAEIDALHEVIDIGMPDIMTEYEKGLLNVPSLCQRHDKMPEISEPRVHLDDDNRGVAGQWTERLLVVHFLLGVCLLDFVPDFCDLQFRERTRTRVRGCVASFFQES